MPQKPQLFSKGCVISASQVWILKKPRSFNMRAYVNRARKQGPFGACTGLTFREWLGQCGYDLCPEGVLFLERKP